MRIIKIVLVLILVWYVAHRTTKSTYESVSVQEYKHTDAVAMQHCDDFSFPAAVVSQINRLDSDFDWKAASCNVVATRSRFPKSATTNGALFSDGFQIFVYQHDHLKFICLPDWRCKAW